jgi:hypothetical protein
MKPRFAVTLVVAASAALLAAGFGPRSDAAPMREGAVIPLLRVAVQNPGSGTLDLARNYTLGTVAALGMETLMKLSPSDKLVP